jgi:acetolactate synthase-1/2/3 large subunit
MNGQELATAVQYDAAIIVLVFDNGTYGTIRMHQERNYPGRVVGTELRNPDFALLARSYGALGFSVTSLDDFKQAFAEARAAAKPCLLHIKMDPDAISPTTTITRLRQGR